MSILDGGWYIFVLKPIPVSFTLSEISLGKDLIAMFSTDKNCIVSKFQDMPISVLASALWNTARSPMESRWRKNVFESH